jgi:hypothetical protein
LAGNEEPGRPARQVSGVQLPSGLRQAVPFAVRATDPA